MATALERYQESLLLARSEREGRNEFTVLFPLPWILMFLLSFLHFLTNVVSS
jgi:hypothetical protein